METTPAHEQVTVGLLGGTGPQGRGLALRFAAAGVPVVLGSRDEERALQVAGELNEILAAVPGQHPVRAAANAAVGSLADIVFLAAPFAHAAELLVACRDRLRPGTSLVDISVPLVVEKRTARLVTPPEGSASLHLLQYVPAGVALLGAFKTIPAHALQKLSMPLDCDVFVCGDAADPKEGLIALINRIPAVRGLDAGGLESAALLEGMCTLAARLNFRYRRLGSRFRVTGLA